MVDYLHTKAEVLHNDIACRNIVLGNAIEKTTTSTTGNYQIVLVDFGKATKLTQGRMYHLNWQEKHESFHNCHLKLLKGTADSVPCMQLAESCTKLQTVSVRHTGKPYGI